MIVPLLARQSRGSSERGTWTDNHQMLRKLQEYDHFMVDNVLHACLRTRAGRAPHLLFQCNKVHVVTQVHPKYKLYLVMLSRPAQPKSTKITRSTSCPSPTCPMMLGNRTSPCTDRCWCPPSSTVAFWRTRFRASTAKAEACCQADAVKGSGMGNVCRITGASTHRGNHPLLGDRYSISTAYHCPRSLTTRN